MSIQPYDLSKTVTSNRFIALWRFASGFKRHYWLALGSLSLSTVARTLTFFVLGYLVDTVFSNTAYFTLLPSIAAAIVGLALAEGGLAFLSGRMAARTSEGVARRLRETFFNHVQRLPYSYHDGMPTGELIQRSSSDLEAVRRFFADQAIGIGRIVLLFFVNFAAIAFLNQKLALLSVIVVPVIVLVSTFFFRRVSAVYEKYQDQDAVLSTLLQENLAGMRVVRAFARQAFEVDKFEKENQEKYRRGRQLLLLHAMFWPSTDILCAAQVITGYAVGAIMTISGELTLGQYIAYVGLVVYLIWPMRDLGRLIVHASSGLVSALRIMEIFRVQEEPLEEGALPLETQCLGEVEFRHVDFEYRGEARVLRDISFHCQPGQVVALLGTTGSGKTSLVNLLPRFYDYTGGSILLDGKELRDYPRSYLRHVIGIVEQEPFLFSRSIRENITYGVGRAVTDADVEEAARAAAIHDVVMGFPQQYATIVGEKGVTVSGGQKQRIAIARTLLKNPRLLILDDSTSSVDTETEAEIRAALDRLMKGRTTFLIAHRIQSVMHADQILVLEGGHLRQHGTHAELLAQPGLYRRIFEIQEQIERDVAHEEQCAAVAAAGCI
jgi:ATP-binding cassette, subfamily B, bacterial